MLRKLLRSCWGSSGESEAGMADELPAAIVIAALGELGLAPLYAERAAGDKRIAWTAAALEACTHDIDTSTMRKPANALWSTYLQHGQLPALPRSVQPPADELRCPVPDCEAHGDLAICHGVHGYAVKLWQDWIDQDRHEDAQESAA